MKINNSISRFISNNTIWILIIVYVLVRSYYWDCFPVWDGMIHYTVLIDAIISNFDILNYCNDNHICQGFMLFMALPYEFYKENYYAFNIWLTLVAVSGIVAFYYLLLFFFKSRLKNIEIVLITSLFIFHPSVLSAMTLFTIDTGVLIFFIFYWLMLLKGKRWAAGIFAFLLLFSKETSMLLVPLPFMFCLLWQPSSAKRTLLKEFGKYFYTKTKETAEVLVPIPVLLRSLIKLSSERIQWLKRNFLIVLIPYFFLGLFMLYKVFIRHQPAIWNKLSKDAVTLDYFGSDGRFVTYLGMIFLLNFNYILTVLWLVLLVVMIVKRNSINDLFQKKLTLLFTLLFISGLVVLTLVVSWAQPRYVMLLIPFMLLAIAQLSSVLISSKYVRIAGGILLLILFAVEDVRTVDPISKAFFGTFDFGEHKLLNLISRTHEENTAPGNYTTTQLTYNLEYLKISPLLNSIYSDIRPTAQTTFVYEPWTEWLLMNHLDSNYKMAYRGSDLVMPRIVTVDDIVRSQNLNPDVYYIELPNIDNRDLIERLNRFYPFKVSKTYDIDGYQANVIHYQKK